MKVEIENSYHADQMFEYNNCKWSVPRLISLAKDLEIFDCPLIALNISEDKIRNDSLRSFVAHMKQTLAVSIEYPIILDEDGVIMDGRHRIAKALLDGRETIKAVRFSKNPEPDVIRTQEDET